MDVIDFNTDNKAVRDIQLSYDMHKRSMFVLIDPNKNVIKTWFAFSQMAAEIEQQVATLGF